jgi:hypothetical protein
MRGWRDSLKVLLAAAKRDKLPTWTNGLEHALKANRQRINRLTAKQSRLRRLIRGDGH